MPNLPTHVSLALRVAARVSYPSIDRHLGCFLLGATAPDIRIVTKSERDQTHFAPLAIDRVGAGVEGLSRTHPGLADASKLNDETQVFLSGYFTHLVADETWILDIYRTYFDGHSPAGDQVLGNIWDRALQLDMDRAAREELGDMEEVRSLLKGSESGVDVGFIGPDTLGEWREWVTKFTTWEFSWDRLRMAARRMYGDRPEPMALADEFVQGMPASLEGVYAVIPQRAISCFQERVIAGSVSTIKEYLGGP